MIVKILLALSFWKIGYRRVSCIKTIFFSLYSFFVFTQLNRTPMIFPCRDIGPATATLDPRPATRDPRLLVKLIGKETKNTAEQVIMKKIFIYARASVKKEIVHSGSVGLI